MGKSELKIRYVLIEMIENDESKMANASIITGLFKGIRIYQPPKEDMLVLVKEDKKDTIHLLNTNKYNILSLQKFDGYTKIIHCFRATEEDQKLAVSTISNIIKELNESDRTVANDDNIIDTSTYTDIPEDITIIKQCTSATNTNVQKRTVHTSHTPRTSTVKSPIHKDPEPKYFKRSRKPTEVALAKMQEKIDDIRKGTYQVKLPTIKGDDIEIAKADDDDNDALGHNNNYYMHG